MYRNIHYNNRESIITEWTWDDVGNHVERRETFLPFLYVETSEPDPDAMSIFDTPLRKLEFDKEWERRKFAEKTNKRVFFNIPVKQQYLLEKYANTSMDDMVQFPLKTYYIDIEVYSHDTFPEADEADFPINVITFFDTDSQLFYSWGLEKEYDPSQLDEIGLEPDQVKYVSCSSEVDLLECFLNYWSNNYPDVVTGWNTSTFDIPYIVNRIRKLLGESEVKKLSPVGNIYSRPRKNYWDRYYTHWILDGVADIDDLELYAKSEMNDKESHTLDYIAKLEGVDGKVAFESANLATLADEDWDTFVTYNIQDVNIMVKLEAKKRYLRVARGKAYRGFSPLEKALDSVPIVTGMIAKAGLDDNQIIVSAKPPEESADFVGGYVFKPSGKVHRGIVSFDVNSLYPNTMITLNTSPETKVGRVHRISDDQVRLELVSGKSKIISTSELKATIKKHNLIITKSNVLFHQRKMGICAKFLDDMYKDRKAIQKQMRETDDEVLKDKLDIEQYLLKILLNSVYGVFGNKYFPLYDLDIAESVTKTGQAMIRKSTDIMKDEALKRANVTDEITVYGDTDSNFFDFDKILKNMGVEFFREIDGEMKVTPEALVVIDEFEDNLNDEINDWAISQLNTNDPRYHFSREKICLIGTFLTKKNYNLRVLNNEGEDCDKLAMAGVELKKSSHSDPVKELILKVLKCIFYETGKGEANKFYNEALDNFKGLPAPDIALRKNIKNHEKWLAMAKGNDCGKGTPQHHKGAIYYNSLIDELGLGGKYPKISSGQKVKMVYLEKNKRGMRFIAFIDALPPEFELSPDYDIQFKKMVTPLIQRCYIGSDWRLPNIDKPVTLDLFEFLGIEENDETS